jgi:hypothetical protein
LPDNPAIFVSSVICEAVLCEKNSEVLTAVRIMDTLTLPPALRLAHFFVLTFFHAPEFEIATHVAKVQMLGMRSEQWVTVAQAPDQKFVYGRRFDPTSPGGFSLTTEFNVDFIQLDALGTHYIQVMLDGVLVAQMPLTLRR